MAVTWLQTRHACLLRDWSRRGTSFADQQAVQVFGAAREETFHDAAQDTGKAANRFGKTLNRERSLVQAVDQVTSDSPERLCFH